MTHQPQISEGSTRSASVPAEAPLGALLTQLGSLKLPDGAWHEEPGSQREERAEQRLDPDLVQERALRIQAALVEFLDGSGSRIAEMREYLAQVSRLAYREGAVELFHCSHGGDELFEPDHFTLKIVGRGLESGDVFYGEVPTVDGVFTDQQLTVGIGRCNYEPVRGISQGFLGAAAESELKRGIDVVRCIRERFEQSYADAVREVRTRVDG